MKKWEIHIMALCLLLVLGTKDIYALPTKEKVDQVVTTEQTVEIQDTGNTATVLAVGDIMFHMPQIKSAMVGRSYDFRPHFDEIKETVESADIAFCNFETVIHPGKKLSGYPSFNAPVETLNALKYAGFDVLNLANNHIMDKGLDGLKHSERLIREHELVPVGLLPKTKDVGYIKEINNIKVGFLTYTSFVNGKKDAGKYVCIMDSKKIKQDIEKIRDKCDFLIVYLHTGTEYLRSISQKEIKLFREIGEFGADCVLSSHPHIARKTEIIDVQGRKVLINYSMGNFISNQNAKYTDIGVMVKLHITKDDTQTKLDKYELIPTYRLRYDVDKKVNYSVIETQNWESYTAIDKYTGSYISNVSSELETVNEVMEAAQE